MYYRVIDHRLPILLLLISLTCLIALTAEYAVTSAKSPVTSAQPAGSPLRLRLRVDKNTLRRGEATNIFVEFLDSNYDQVANDRARLIDFDTASVGSQVAGSGAISPSRISVGPGSWSGTVSFAAGQAGKLFVKASSEELDSARSLMLITSEKASLIQSLEPVAFAESNTALMLYRTDPLADTPNGALPVPANDTTPAQFSITVPSSESEQRTLKITADANVRLFYRRVNEAGSKVQTIEGLGSISIPVLKGVEIVDGLNVFSKNEGTVTLTAGLPPDASLSQTTVRFESPVPKNIMFYEAPPTISPGESVSVRIGVGDQAKVKIAPTGNYKIALKSPRDAAVVRFTTENPSLTLTPNQQSVGLNFQLMTFPPRGKIELLAEDQDGNLFSNLKAFPIESEIKRLVVTGRTDLARGTGEEEFTIHLEDKDGKWRAADCDRSIDLSVNDGELISRQVTIPKGQGQTVVKWRLHGSGDSAILTAESFPLDPYRHQVRLFTPAYRLVLMALLGGVMGGLARQLHKGHRLEKILPRWTGKDWDLGLVGRISGSVVSGLFLYWTMKFGLARVTLDLGTAPVATFFGGIGGFAGLVVLDRLVEWCFKLLQWSLPGKKGKAVPGQLASSASVPGALLKTP
jgi:hypothetical protein